MKSVIMGYDLPFLPPKENLETVPILKKVASAHRYLAELKGISRSIPNQGILINTLSLQEAKDSSAIENIITTHDELFKEELFPEYAANASAKEVRNYASALIKGGYLHKEKIGRSNFYINKALFRILTETGDEKGEVGL